MQAPGLGYKNRSVVQSDYNQEPDLRKKILRQTQKKTWDKV